jgi:DNA-binding IclR family transcriptional regulator
LPTITRSKSAKASPPVRRTKGINSVERALSILDLFMAEGSSRGLSELSKGTGLVKPTVLRCLVSLQARGYVVRLPTGRYQLGAKLLQLGNAYRSSFRLDEHVLPVLRELADETGESASFHVRQDNERLCLFRIESSQVVRDIVKPGMASPLDDSSMGLVLVEAERQKALAKFARERIVFSSTGVRAAQTASLATAVYGSDGSTPVGALAISGPINRFTLPVKRGVFRRLAKTADALSVVLGCDPALIGRTPRLVNEYKGVKRPS